MRPSALFGFWGVSTIRGEFSAKSLAWQRIPLPPLPTVDIDLLGWSDSPPKQQGDASEDDIYLGVRRALTAWEVMESQFAMAFSRFCSGRYGEALLGASGRAYGSVPGGGTRKNMLQEIAEIYSVFGNRNFDIEGFKKLLTHYGNAARTRNNIAHGMACKLSVEQEEAGWFLVPAMYLTSRNVRVDKWDAVKSKPAVAALPSWGYSYTGADLSEITAKYKALGLKVGRVVSDELSWQVNEMMGRADQMRASSTIALRDGLQHRPPSEEV